MVNIGSFYESELLPLLSQVDGPVPGFVIERAMIFLLERLPYRLVRLLPAHLLT